MREFFHGWRRKVGCITLLMVCGLTGMWARSRVFQDIVFFDFGSRVHTIHTYGGVLTWHRHNATPGQPNITTWTGRPIGRDGLTQAMLKLMENESWRFDRTVWVIPFRKLVPWCAIFSTYLLFWKPRKRKAETDA